jgi:hypothetical protein
MSNQKNASLSEVLEFLKNLGVNLTDEAVKALEKKMKDEPVGKPVLQRSENMAGNPLFMNVLDKTLHKRVEKIKEFTETHPVLKALDESRKRLKNDSDSKPMPEKLKELFFDENRWQPFIPVFGIPEDEIVVKVIEAKNKNRTYAGILYSKSGNNYIRTTRREIMISRIADFKIFQLKSGVLDKEIAEQKSLEKAYYDYIMSFEIV